jgi:Rad3-related DNA helicase
MSAITRYFEMAPETPSEKPVTAIHCHSYDHQKALFDNLSEDLRHRLIIHTRRDRDEKLREWMQSRGKVFLSVAFNEGRDWKYDVCDAQILLKVPFPDLGDRRVKRRLDMGRERWYDNQAMLEVIQAYGRAVRAEDDKARFYVVDGSFQRLVRNCWQFIPDWFKEVPPESFVQCQVSRRERIALGFRWRMPASSSIVFV